MNSRKRRLIRIDLTKAQRDMNITRGGVPISHQLKLAVGRLQRSFADTLHSALVGNAIVNKIRDGADLDAVLLHEARKGRTISELAVLIQYIGNHTGRCQTRDARVIHGGFRMTGTSQHATRLCGEGKDVAGLHDVRRLCVTGHRHLHRQRTICGRDTRIDALRRLNG